MRKTDSGSSGHEDYWDLLDDILKAFLRSLPWLVGIFLVTYGIDRLIVPVGMWEANLGLVVASIVAGVNMLIIRKRRMQGRSDPLSFWRHWDWEEPPVHWKQRLKGEATGFVSMIALIVWIFYRADQRGREVPWGVVVAVALMTVYLGIYCIRLLVKRKLCAARVAGSNNQ